MSAKSSRVSLSNTSTETLETKFAKLRRLKMQEKILYNNINLSIETNNIDMQQLAIVENKRNALLTEIKNNFQDIQSLFHEVKYNAENVDNIDLQQIKRDVLTLEDNIIILKRLLHKEINSLKIEEEKLLLQINDEIDEVHKPINKTMTRVKTFNDIVPSPVKNIINTPYKYKEVQALHEFLRGNGGKYGGWHEFNHNLFVHCRQKYLQNISPDVDDLPYHNALKQLVKELLVRVIGTTSQKIIDHEKWYIKYLELKTAQEDAMKKWRQSRSHSKRSDILGNTKVTLNNKRDERSVDNKNVRFQSENTGMSPVSNEPYLDIDETDIESYPSFKCMKNTGKNSDKIDEYCVISKVFKSKLFQPTEVWTNRLLQRRNNNETNNTCYNLDTINKYGTPKWRKPLLNN